MKKLQQKNMQIRYGLSIPKIYLGTNVTKQYFLCDNIFYLV